MLVRCHHDPREFLELVEPFLLAREVENALPLGLARAYVDSATHEGLMFSVESGADSENGAAVVAVALKSPKRNIVLTRAPDLAVVALVRYLHEYALPVPGVNGPEETARAFCEAWTALAGQTCQERMRLRLHELTRVATPDDAVAANGTFRFAEPGDAALVEGWLRAFIDEATHDTHEGLRERVAQMIGVNNVGLWSDATLAPTSMAAVTRRSARGAHVAWVYTPPAHRGRGHATACVAELARRELAAGRHYLTLYTDLANVTSNRMYERIGFAPVCDAIDATFH